MSKTLKILLIIAITFCFAFTLNCVLATSDEDNISDTTENISNENTTNNDEESTNVVSENVTDKNSLSTLSTSNGTRVEPINSYSEANLQLNNILSIILISIGVLLILFAIALLIRIRK